MNLLSKSASRHDQAGVSLVEVAILIALLSIVSLIGMRGMGNSIRDEFNDTSVALGPGGAILEPVGGGGGGT